MSPWRTIGAVDWRMSPDARDTVEYRPREPAPARLETGRPSVLLLQGGGGFHLQLQCQWDPPADALEALRSQLQDELGRPLRLAPPASLQVHDALLELAGSRGAWKVLQRVPTSGYPPYGAAFAVSLDEQDGALMAGALRGTRGRLAVRFRGTTRGLALDRRADVAAWFGPGQEVEPLVVATDVRALSRPQPHS